MNDPYKALKELEERMAIEEEERRKNKYKPIDLTPPMCRKSPLPF